MKIVRLNNKGFAITTILYTIFILFLMLLVSTLALLSNKKRLLEKSIESVSDDFSISSTSDSDISDYGDTAIFSGLYVFSYVDDNNNNVDCYTYLNSKTFLKSNYNFSLSFLNDEDKVCYKKWISEKLILNKVYKFDNIE